MAAVTAIIGIASAKKSGQGELFKMTILSRRCDLLGGQVQIFVARASTWLPRAANNSPMCRACSRLRVISRGVSVRPVQRAPPWRGFRVLDLEPISRRRPGMTMLG
jgi:hypothetical protein